MSETIALADDHILLRNGLANLLRDLEYSVVLEADNGKDLIQKMKGHPPPQVILLDINMPLMNGYDTALWLKNHHPAIKIIALSMYDDETSIIRMLKNGARGYLLKDSDPLELNTAIQSVIKKGFYYSGIVPGRLMDVAMHEDEESALPAGPESLNDKELQFLKLVCTELTYKEIAEQLSVSPRTIDGWRDNLFQKLKIKSRVGLVLFSIRHGLIAV